MSVDPEAKPAAAYDAGPLVDVKECMAILWPNAKTRPSLRWFKELQHNREIPFRRIKGRVFFDVAEVRRVLDEKFKVEAK
jgi:hypothetical protein